MKQNKKLVMQVFLLITLIGLVSASSVVITPSHIDMTAFPGENKTFNFSVKTDGEYLVKFESSSSYVTIIPSELTLNNGDNFSLSFKLSPLTPNGTLSFETKPLIEIPSEATIGSSGGSSGGYYYSRYNKKNETINEEENNKSIPLEKDNGFIPKGIINQKNAIGFNFLQIFALVSLILLIILLIKYKIWRKRQ